MNYAFLTFWAIFVRVYQIKMICKTAFLSYSENFVAENFVLRYNLIMKYSNTNGFIIIILFILFQTYRRLMISFPQVNKLLFFSSRLFAYAQ